ncbi:MAG: N-acetyl-gamma-glutamyl-phosphate reductase [Phototrophicales bacterium]|nr:MAG: N-acetyl-gamma-glutamyl-phosphate reductase [Phototrophicales bacterium]
MRVGIFGASGYAGQDLVEILARHPHVEIIFATSSTYAGERVPFTHLHYIPPDHADLTQADVIFLALPHKESAIIAAQGKAAGVKVIDLSADLRLDDPSTYERWYKIPHPHPELLHDAPYGLVEINREKLHNADLVAVPGCYPTATLLGLYPLLKADALQPDAPIIVDAKSGVSGAGRVPKSNTHFVEVFGNLSPYSPGRSHRHISEMEQEIHKINPNAGTLIFTPHLIPVDRGLMSSIYVTLKPGFDDPQALYEEVYQHESLVDVLPVGEQATLRHAVRKNNCAISLTPINGRYLHITSVIDNLRKGAAGQAVQCFNVMMNYPETIGLL